MILCVFQTTILNNTITSKICINLLVTCDHYTDTHPKYNKPRDPRIESDEVMPPRPHLRQCQ